MFADFHKVEISPNLRGRLNRWDRVLIIPLHKIVGSAAQASHPPHESGFQSRIEFWTKFVSADMLNEVKSAEFQVFQFQLNYRRQFYIQIFDRNLLRKIACIPLRSIWCAPQTSETGQFKRNFKAKFSAGIPCWKAGLIGKFADF